MIPRVTLDRLFPRARYSDEPIPGIAKLTGPMFCTKCLAPTEWAQLNGEYPICSMVCDDAFSAGFWYALAWSPETGLRMEDHTNPGNMNGIGSRQIEEMNRANLG